MTIFNAPDFHEHEQVVFANDNASGLKAIIAIHNTSLGPALGGCRMYNYLSEDAALKDVLRLSRGMTYKAALAGLPLGGGKSVVLGDPVTQKSPALFRALGRAVDRLSGQYVIAQDSGTSIDDLKIVAEETQYVGGAKNSFDNYNRLRSGDPSPATAYGVMVGIKSALNYKTGCDNLSGKKVAIQGVGNVGFALARNLKKEGVKLYVSDINPLNVQRAVSELGAISVEGDDIYGLDVDVFSPCALGAVINDSTIDQLSAPIIAGSANNQLQSEAHGLALHNKGMLYAPDFVISAGGLIHVHYMRTNRTWMEATKHVEEIYDTLSEIFSRSRMQKQTTSIIANQLACERLYRDDQRGIHGRQVGVR